MFASQEGFWCVILYNTHIINHISNAVTSYGAPKTWAKQSHPKECTCYPKTKFHLTTEHRLTTCH